MKVNELRRELKKANDVQLYGTLEELRKQLFTLKINSATSHVKDCSQFLKLRKSIARVVTEITARKLKGVGSSVINDPVGAVAAGDDSSAVLGDN